MSETERRAEPRFSAPFRELIHNVHQFGEHWSWRCGVWYSREDEGYRSGACRYDHTVTSWDQLMADATDHLARWHDIHPIPAPVPRGTLAQDLAAVLNRHSVETAFGNTPDFILAEYLTDCLNAFGAAVGKRDRWYGVDWRPGQRLALDDQ